MDLMVEELERMIQKMKMHKELYHDEMTTEIIKFVIEERKPELLSVFHQAQ